MTRPLTAAQRTLWIPGVDVREQSDLAALPEPEPTLQKVFFGYVRLDGKVDGCLHLCPIGSTGVRTILCGWQPPEGSMLVGSDTGRSSTLQSKAICQACRVEASRIGAVLR